MSCRCLRGCLSCSLEGGDRLCAQLLLVGVVGVLVWRVEGCARVGRSVQSMHQCFVIITHVICDSLAC